jgi:hypothetical protein
VASSAHPFLDVRPDSRAQPVRDGGGTGLVEFLLVGGGTLVVFPLLWLLRKALGLDAAELAVGFVAFYGAHLINDPHFSVTYFLFYRDVKRRVLGNVWGVAQRARYVVAGFVVPAALAVWAGVGLATHSASVLGLMVQLMFALVGWHYVKQAFGVVAVLSARRGITFTRRERAALLAHCFAGWAYAWSSPADLGTEVEEKGVVFTTFAHGPLLERVTLVVFIATLVPLVGALWLKWRRERRLPLGPLVAMLLTVWCWTAFTTLDPLMVYVIPALHSVQYLYFVWLLRRNQALEATAPPSFGPSVRAQLLTLAALALGLGFLQFHALPALLDGALVARHAASPADLALGPTPYFAAIFAFVNIHHYFMDYVVWRRENPETRHLRD